MLFFFFRKVEYFENVLKYLAKLENCQVREFSKLIVEFIIQMPEFSNSSAGFEHRANQK